MGLEGPVINLKESEKLSEAINHSSLKEIRNDMIDGKKIKGCEGCYEKERIGHVSPRIVSNNQFREEVAHIDKNPNSEINIRNIQYTDIRFSNTCNLACRMCNSYSSTLWNKDSIALGLADKPINIKMDRPELLHELDCQEYYFAGGEPLLESEHLKFLQHLVDHKDPSQIHLLYNSNLLLIERIEKELSVLWPKFKKITFSASIDHIGDKFEYIRYPAKWDNMHMAFENKLLKSKNLTLKLALVLSAYNIFDLPEIINYFKEEIKVSFTNMIIEPLITPSYLSIISLTSEQKNECITTLSQYRKEILVKYGLENEVIHMTSLMNSIISQLTEHDESATNQARIQFISFNTKLDARRNQSFSTLYPNF